MTDWHTTSTILENLRSSQNVAAWRRFDERFRRPIVGFARRMGLSETDAEDVAQETLSEFAAAFRDGKFNRDRGRLSTWLFGIAYRQTLSGRRSHQRAARAGTPLAETTFWQQVPDEETASRSWDQEWEQALLQQCLDQVAREVESTTFHAFRLVVGEERAAADAARQLGVPIKSVYNAKHRVLKRLREIRATLEDVN